MLRFDDGGMFSLKAVSRAIGPNTNCTAVVKDLHIMPYCNYIEYGIASKASPRAGGRAGRSPLAGGRSDGRTGGCAGADCGDFFLAIVQFDPAIPSMSFTRFAKDSNNAKYKTLIRSTHTHAHAHVTHRTAPHTHTHTHTHTYTQTQTHTHTHNTYCDLYYIVIAHLRRCLCV